MNTQQELYSKDKTIHKLIDFILLNSNSVNICGLYNGKAGIALALFEAARYLHDDEIENEAFRLLQEALLSKKQDFSFENGLTGIGYALLYLIQNKFVDADFDEIFGTQYKTIIESFTSIENDPPDCCPLSKLFISFQ